MKEVKCNICGENMECQETLDASKHICSHCTDAMNSGVDEKDVKEVSLQDRKMSEYYPDTEFLINFVHSLTHKPAQIPKVELKEMSKKEIMEYQFYQGIVTGIKFILENNPESIRKTKETIIKELTKSLSEEGKSPEAIKKIIDSMMPEEEDTKATRKNPGRG